MSLISEGINNVKADFICLGCGASGAVLEEQTEFAVSWKTEHSDKLHQVYVNGKLAGASYERGLGWAAAAKPAGSESLVTVEVYAITGDDPWEDHGYVFAERQYTNRVKITFAREMDLPGTGVVRIFGNGGSGEIDESQPVAGPLALWRNLRQRGGWGLGAFGETDFGWDGGACPGFGLGALGMGRFGFDADQFAWISPELEKGRHAFKVEVSDETGRKFIFESGEIGVVPVPGGAEYLKPVGYDEEGNELILKTY